MPTKTLTQIPEFDPKKISNDALRNTILAIETSAAMQAEIAAHDPALNTPLRKVADFCWRNLIHSGSLLGAAIAAALPAWVLRYMILLLFGLGILPLVIGV